MGAALPDVPLLDGGPSHAGVESTILAVDGDTLTQLRAGALPRDEIERVLGRPIAIAKEGDPVAAPGMLASHYAPRAALRLDATSARPGETYLGFGAVAGAAQSFRPPATSAKPPAISLPCCTSSTRAPRASPSPPSPAHGLGEAITDRLRRAAAPR